MDGGRSMTRPTIKVTKEHIANSTRNDATHCMIAEAIRAAMPWAKYISVDTQAIRISSPGESLRYFYLTPLRVQKALLGFDRGETVSPFSFWLKDKPIVHPMRRGGN